VKNTRNEECPKDLGQQGEWQTKAILVIQEMGCVAGRVFAVLVRIHPRTRQERPAHFISGTQSAEM
jgi:hypothetical protein